MYVCVFGIGDIIHLFIQQTVIEKHCSRPGDTPVDNIEIPLVEDSISCGEGESSEEIRRQTPQYSVTD